MYLLLPPSETKHPGGDGPPLDWDGLPFPSLTATRQELATELVAVSADPAAAARSLHVSLGLAEEVLANTELAGAPTLPALRRYTGVLYTALHTPALSPAEWSRASERVLIISALFGLLRADSRIPAYRLSAASRLPGRPTMAALWRPELTEVLARLDAPVVDLRSGAYAAFGQVPGAISVRVVTPGPRGTVLAVSHDNKSTKGRLARLLATSRAELTDVRSILRLTYRAGWRVERSGPLALDVYR